MLFGRAGRTKRQGVGTAGVRLSGLDVGTIVSAWGTWLGVAPPTNDHTKCGTNFTRLLFLAGVIIRVYYLYYVRRQEYH